MSKVNESTLRALLRLCGLIVPAVAPNSANTEVSDHNDLEPRAFTALGQQTVVVVGTSAAGIVLPKLPEQLLALRRQRAHLASYAEIAPVTRRSGASIRGERPSRCGNKKLKRAVFLSAFAALHHPPTRAYYDRKRAEGKRHNQAIIALARRRCDVLFAMLRDGTH